MEYKELVQVFYERSSALLTYWTLWLALLGAFLSFCASRQALGTWALSLITAMFVCLSAANLQGMTAVTDQRAALKQAIVDYPPDKNPQTAHVQALLQSTFRLSRRVEIISFHITCDILAIATFWIISYRKRSIAAKKPAS